MGVLWLTDPVLGKGVLLLPDLRAWWPAQRLSCVGCSLSLVLCCFARLPGASFSAGVRMVASASSLCCSIGPEVLVVWLGLAYGVN